MNEKHDLTISLLAGLIFFVKSWGQEAEKAISEGPLFQDRSPGLWEYDPSES